jgi:rSAM/selenodomain-associated transferase 2
MAGARDKRGVVLSIIIPTLNAAEHLPATLAALVPGAWEGLVKEVIIVDGGSTDATCKIAAEAGAIILPCEKGRGRQLARGASQARAAWLLFLHADTILDESWVLETKTFMAAPRSARRAAAFRFALDSRDDAARRVEWWVAQRCRVFKLPYGDQGLLISRSHYDAIGGFRPIDLMEDVDIVRRIGGRNLVMLNTRARTSAAKFLRDGYTKRAIRNLSLVARFYMGADPNELARVYD